MLSAESIKPKWECMVSRVLFGLVDVLWIVLNFVWVFLRIPVIIFAGLKVFRVWASYPNVPQEAVLTAGIYVAVLLIAEGFMRVYKPRFFSR